MTCDTDCQSCITSGTCSLCIDATCILCETFLDCGTCVINCEEPRLANCDLAACVCPTGLYWWPAIEECLPYCSTGTIPDDFGYCSLQSDLLMDIMFTTFDASIEIFPYGILIEPSSKQSYHESPGEYPVPVQDRGYFFGESTAYLMIDGCQDYPLILPATFTFRKWIRPEPVSVGTSATLLATS